MDKIIALCTIFAVLFGCVFCIDVEDEQSIKLHFYDGSSKWWIAVDPRDDIYETVKVEVREAADNEWTTMMHDEGWPYFHLPSTTGRGFALPLSFRFTSDNGEELSTLVYRIGSNLLVDTKVQYNGSIIEPPTEVPTNSPSPTESVTIAPTESATSAPTEPATQAPTQPATIAPTQPATQAPTVAPTQPATVAPTQPATQAPTIAPTQTATSAPTQPATQAPTQPATQAPTQPATQAPTQPATVAPTQPATVAPTQPATVAPTRPATVAPTQPATQAPTQPATVAPTQPATQPPTVAPTSRPSTAPTTRPTDAATQPPTIKPTQPATVAPTQPATPAPTKPATPAPTQPATQAPTKPATPAPTQPATQAPTPSPTPKATPAPTQPSVDNCALVSVKSEPLKILVPLYVYPGAAWDTIIAAAKTGVKIIAIINPNSGPKYDGPDASYTKYMKKFQEAGVEMVGYVHTSWGARSINTVNTEIGIYATKYPGVTGIFFDEAATEASQVSYYRTAYNTVLSKGFVHSILNPGTQPDQQYLDISSNIVIFENYASALPTTGYSNWVKCASSSSKKSGYSYKFSAIIHTASQSSVNALIQRTHDLGMGLIYITDGPGGCCTYNYLNTYFAAQAAAVKSFNNS